MTIVIRSLDTQDVASFRDIRLEALRLAPEAFGSVYEREAAQNLGFFADRLAGSTVFGGFAGKDLLGIAGFKQEDGLKERHKAMLWGMYVRPVARGAGLAAGLVGAVLDHASGRVERVLLTLVDGNQAARRLYETAGFVEYGRERHALKLDGRYYDEVLMAAELI